MPFLYATLFLPYHNNFTLTTVCMAGFPGAGTLVLVDGFRDAHEHVRLSIERTERHSCSDNDQDLPVCVLDFFSSVCD